MARFIVAVVVAVLFALPTFAQELEILGGVRLRFDEPGARGAAMGGASVALDDLFTVATNPAALARQKQRTIAIEGRSTSDTTTYISGGNVGAFTHSSFDVDSTALRSAMVVLPGRRANWALYYDEPLSTTHNTPILPFPPQQTIQLGVRGNDLVPLDDCLVPEGGPSDCLVIGYFGLPAIFPTFADVHLRRYGAAAATTFGDRVALGASVQYARLDQNTRSNFGSGQITREGRLTWNAGAQIDLTKAIRFGASYRGGATYDSVRTLQGFDNVQRTEGSFATPSSYAAGLAADVTPKFTVAVDAVRMNYSEMTDALPHYSDPNSLFLEIPDVTELRAGAEYRLGTRVPVALRAGWWHEPAHRGQFGGGWPGLALLMNKLNMLDQDENHVTAGIGIGDRVRFDAAVDRSENTSRASVGVATTF